MTMATFHSILTILALLVFAGIVFWAYSSRSKQQFERAAMSVLLDDQHDEGGRGARP
jgi:cytochrome c oxidase cbb3-type subunit 4